MTTMNRTLRCDDAEIKAMSKKLVSVDNTDLNNFLDNAKIIANIDSVKNKVIHNDFDIALNILPNSFADLVIIDPPYNLTKNFRGKVFAKMDDADYASWFNDVILKMLRTIKKDASIYVCSDWRTSTIILPILKHYFDIRNRITWEREKGRGAKRNWKNNTEDIWFCTSGEDYYFDVDAVKLKKKVLAPYKDDDGNNKDWVTESDGNYRMTYPSNIWTDLSIPFWSMPENTDHPTQKPEKLIAKLILASSEKGDVVFDPFLGSGTTAVVAKKLGRNFVGIEENLEYCCWAQKRLSLADSDKTIQGYENGVFYERNSKPKG